MEPSTSIRKFNAFWWDDQGLSAFLLLLFVSLFLAPFIDSLLLRFISSLFFSLLLIAGAVYLLVGLTWSFIYQLCDITQAGAFNLPATHHLDPETRQEEFTYFSFITLTTLGYGDITAVHPIARMFVIFEALLGQLYPATLLARLVSLEVVHRQERDAEP